MAQAATQEKPAAETERELTDGFHLVIDALKLNGIDTIALTKLDVLDDFEKIPVCTSYNVRGEPIVCTPEDAFRCFMGNELDLLVVGQCVLKKSAQDPALKQDYSSAFELD